MSQVMWRLRKASEAVIFGPLRNFKSEFSWEVEVKKFKEEEDIWASWSYTSL